KKKTSKAKQKKKQPQNKDENAQPKQKKKTKEPATVIAQSSPGKTESSHIESGRPKTPQHATLNDNPGPSTATSPHTPRRNLVFNSLPGGLTVSPLGVPQNYSPIRTPLGSPHQHSPVQSISFCSSPPYLPSLSSLSSVLNTPTNPRDHSLKDILLRIESKLDVLARVENKLDMLLENQSTTVRESPPQSMPSPVHVQQETPLITRTNEGATFSPAEIRSLASSHKNFAVRVLREICTQEEMKGRNIAGCRGKQAIDKNKVQMIQCLVKEYYPVAPAEAHRTWTECRKAMDSYLRRLSSKES
ncbi:uncharacterized protein LOC110234932, partial [Exaiptasia diaphana]|uniref:BEN domain-containing protein n=1 Tax=Exaiptasia diaphana TaxID=2652724 RepID=A0A913WYC9_EXADI